MGDTNHNKASNNKFTLTKGEYLSKEVSYGFSFITLFLGFLIPLIRGDIKWAVIMFIAAICSFGISMLIFPFIYNKLYVNKLLEDGFKPADNHAKEVIKLKQQNNLKDKTHFWGTMLFIAIVGGALLYHIKNQGDQLQTIYQDMPY